MATETEWRRRWKPSLVASPWQSVHVDGESLLVKTKFSEKSYEVLITDFTSFWYESLEEKAVKKRIEKLNPSIEAPLSKVLDQIKSSLEKPSKDTQLTVAFKDAADGGGQKMLLQIASSLAGMPFVWNFHAQPADSSMARDHLTVPLLAMVSELFRQQRELTSLLSAKDKEIEDYKSQGVRTSRKHIETTKFDNIAFKNTMVTSKGFENQVKDLETVSFHPEGQELYRQIVTKHEWLAYKASGAADEDGELEEESIPFSNQGSAPSKQSWANRLPPSMMSSKVSPAKTPTISPVKSPSKSPAKSPGASSSSSDSTPAKDSEKLRREALERRLEQEEQKKQEKKKKKKLAF